MMPLGLKCILKLIVCLMVFLEKDGFKYKFKSIFYCKACVSEDPIAERF